MAQTEQTDTDLGADFDAVDDVQEGSGQSPGDELFGEVVSEETKRPSKATAPASTGEPVQLRDSVAGIYEMVKDLEVQLNHMVSINEAAERDLEAARKAHRGFEKESDELKRKIEKMELDAQSSAELREELRHMTQENERLIERLREADTKSTQWEKQRQDLADALAHTKLERDELREEVECLEEQIGATGSYLDRLREELSMAREARAQQTRKMELVEQRLHVVTDERDALRQELNESRSALEEIKRSIMDTNMQSQLSYYES